MKTYVLIHSHRHGVSVFPFKSNKEYPGWYEKENSKPNEFKKLLEKLGADVNFDDREFIEFHEIEGHIPIID